MLKLISEINKIIMARILVTGASGQLGNELKNVSKNYFGYEFVLPISNSLIFQTKTR